MIQCDGHAGNRGGSAFEISADQRSFRFITHEKSGKFTSFLYARVMTRCAPDRVQTVHMRTSFAMDTRMAAAHCRDAAIMHLTDGRCLEKNLSGMPCENWRMAEHTKPVCEFHALILDYDAAEDVYLARDDYLAIWNDRKVHGEDRVLAEGECISFGGPEAASTQAVDDTVVRCQDWGDAVGTCTDNILLSAPAGFGKTHVIQNVLRAALEKAHGKNGVWVTASTGLAALALEGVTIHSAAGLTRGNQKAKDLVHEMKATVKNRWKTVRAIIIEEFSMLSANFLDLLHEVACLMKKCETAFGGVMIILVGDVAQMAPVPEFHEVSSPEGPKYRNLTANYAFKGRIWQRARLQCFRLSHCWMYDIDGKLGKFLSALRTTPVLTGGLYEEMKALWTNQEVQLEDDVVLCCRIKDARVWSINKLLELDGQVVV